MADKQLPFSEEAEQAVISAILMDADYAFPHTAFLSGEMFYRENHKALYKALRAIYDRSESVDPVTLALELDRQGTLKKAGGKDYIGDLIDAIPTPANVRTYAKTVEEFYRRREIVRVAREIEQAALDSTLKVEDVARTSFKMLLPYAVDESENGYRRLDPYKTMEHIEERGTNPKATIRIGYKCVDSVFNGFRPGELVIVGGAAKSGKTAWTLNIARNVAHAGHGVGFQSCEMTRDSLTERLLNTEAQVHVYATSKGQMDSDEWARLAKAGDRLAKLPFEVDDTAMPTIDDVCAKALALKARCPHLKMIVVDFLQLVSADLIGKSTADSLTYVSYRLAALAKQTESVVLAPCQNNFKLETPREPELRDLQGSSGMAQAATAVFVVWRTGGGDGAFAGPECFNLKCEASRRTAKFRSQMNWVGKYMLVEEVDKSTGEVTGGPNV